jgi:phospholipase A1/A2
MSAPGKRAWRTPTPDFVPVGPQGSAGTFSFRRKCVESQTHPFEDARMHAVGHFIALREPAKRRTDLGVGGAGLLPSRRARSSFGNLPAGPDLRVPRQSYTKRVARPPGPRSGGWCAAWLVTCFLVGLAWPGFAQNATLVWSGPAEPVPAGTQCSVWLNCLNTSNVEVKKVFAPQLQGRLLAGTRAWPLVLELNPTGGAPEASIQPGAFARREYRVMLPPEARGPVLVEIPAPDPGRLSIDLSELAVATGSTPPGTVKPEEPCKPKEELAQADPVAFFKRHLFGYEPFYFLAGPDSPNAKFQISVKYRLFDPDARLGGKVPPVSDLYLGYTQTSLWDWSAPSAPFVDTSYKPELFYFRRAVLGGGAGQWVRCDLQGGFKHESNGRDGAASRSMNTLDFRPSLVLGHPDSFQVVLAPEAWAYLGDLSDNPDIADYRGYVDLVTKIGWVNGLQLAATLRGGGEFEHGSLQLDLTFPMKQIPWLGLTWYLHAQYFTGYGESFLFYKERSQSFRFGFSLYR